MSDEFAPPGSPATAQASPFTGRIEGVRTFALNFSRPQAPTPAQPPLTPAATPAPSPFAGPPPAQPQFMEMEVEDVVFGGGTKRRAEETELPVPPVGLGIRSCVSSILSYREALFKRMDRLGILQRPGEPNLEFGATRLFPTVPPGPLSAETSERLGIFIRDLTGINSPATLEELDDNECLVEVAAALWLMASWPLWVAGSLEGASQPVLVPDVEVTEAAARRWYLTVMETWSDFIQKAQDTNRLSETTMQALLGSFGGALRIPLQENGRTWTGVLFPFIR